MNKLCKQIDLGIDPMTGRRVRKRIYGTSKTDLERNIKEAISNYAKSGTTSNITFKEYKEKWFSANCSKLAINTINGYRTCLKNTEVIDHLKMKNIIRTDLQKIITDNSDHPYVCRRIAVLLNNIWENAVLDGIVEKNIAHKLKRPKIVKNKRRALTETELKAIANTQFTDSELLMVRILRQFGLRPGEAFALTRKDFNEKSRTLTISKSLTHDGENPIIKSTKTNVIRVLPVPDQFFSYLPKKGLYLFTNAEGKLLTKKQEYNFSQSIIKKINRTLGGTDRLKVTDAVLYTFRHTKATELYYTSGISLKQKAAYMGHSEEEFIRTYSHLDETKEETELLRQAVI